MIDIAFLIIVALVAWCALSEGASGAGMLCISVIFSGLIAMNFYEPLAGFISGISYSMSSYAEFVALLLLFGGFIFGFRAAYERICPTFIQMNKLAQNAGRWTCAVLTGYVTAAFVLTALHTAPLPREFLGFAPENEQLFGLAPDRQWLGFTQYVSEHALSKRGLNAEVFDGQFVKMADYPNEIWPTFIIRNATRRQQFEAGGIVAPTSAAPVQQNAPSTGGEAPAF